MPPGQDQREYRRMPPTFMRVVQARILAPHGGQDGLVEAHDPNYEMFGLPRINRRES